MDTWKALESELPNTDRLGPILTHVSSVEEAAEGIGTKSRTQKLGYIHADFAKRDLLGFDKFVHTMVSTANQIWLVDGLERTPHGGMLLVMTRSGEIYFVTCAVGNAFANAKLNEWTCIAKSGDCLLEAYSLWNARTSVLTCRDVRLTLPANPKIGAFLKENAYSACATLDVVRGSWFGAKVCQTPPIRTLADKGCIYSEETFQLAGGAMTVHSARMAGDHHKRWALEVEPCKPLLHAWYATREQEHLERLERMKDGLLQALAMTSGVSAGATWLYESDHEIARITWSEHDSRPIGLQWHTGVGTSKQVHLGKLLGLAVGALSKTERDPKLDALRRSIRHICHAYEGRFLEQHVLSVCLAVEELATSLLVLEDQHLRQKAINSWKRRSDAEPNDEEVICEALLNLHYTWKRKLEFLHKRFPTVELPQSQWEPSRVLRNGIVHSGRLLPSEDIALEALHHLEVYWHRLAWSACGDIDFDPDVGLFHVRAK